jgi:hypothetical protein
MTPADLPPAIKGLGTVAVAALAAWAFFSPPPGSWVFAVAELVFLAWLAREVRKADAAPLAAAASEPLKPDEAEIVRRFAFYFTRPPLAREFASILAALGLASLVLVPWLTYKLQWAQAILIGLLLFAVARLTKLLGPLFALRLAANTGDRDALRLLAAHDAALRKVRN